MLGSKVGKSRTRTGMEPSLSTVRGLTLVPPKNRGYEKGRLVGRSSGLSNRDE